MKRTLRAIFLLILAPLAFAQSSADKISPEFSTAAIRLLTVTRSASGAGANLLSSAFVDAESTASTPAEEKVMQDLWETAQPGFWAKRPIQPGDCYTTWKASLRTLSAERPSICK